MTTNKQDYPPSPCENMALNSDNNNEFNFASNKAPFGIPNGQYQDILSDAQRLKQTAQILDNIERNQAVMPQRFESLSAILDRSNQVENEILELSLKATNSNYQQDAQKLSSLLSSRKNPITTFKPTARHISIFNSKVTTIFLPH
jgi:hypothetical protein